MANSSMKNGLNGDSGERSKTSLSSVAQRAKSSTALGLQLVPTTT